MRKMHSKEELEALVSGGGGISYSTEEQDTGLTWIDGKKIYQKTFSKTNIAGEETQTILGSIGPVNLISIEATMKYPNTAIGQSTIAGSYVTFMGDKIYLFVSVASESVMAYTSQASSAGKKNIYATVRYTKPE